MLIHVQTCSEFIDRIRLSFKQLNIPILNELLFSIADRVEPNEDFYQIHAGNDYNFYHFSSFEDRKGAINIVQVIRVRMVKP